MNNEQASREWLDFAEMDYRSARFLMLMRPVPLEIICYHCEQTAEKMLKGFLVYHDVDVPKTHDLSMLCELCNSIAPEFSEISGICMDLSPYAVQVRYPFHIELEERDMQSALNDCEAVRDFINERLKLEPVLSIQME